ncbi:Poly [ADP-ribose] polymerase [Dirofilaria immitis]
MMSMFIRSIIPNSLSNLIIIYIIMSLNYIKNYQCIENLCHTGMKQSPILIDANEIEQQNDSDIIFKFTGFDREETSYYRTLHFRPTELSITGFYDGPWLQYDKKTFALYKIRFIFKYGLKGGLHQLINFDRMDKPVGEIIMEFEICDKDVNKKQYFFVSSMLTLVNPTKSRQHKAGQIIDFDNLFFGHPIPKYHPSGPPTKAIQIPTSLRYFIPYSFTGAISYIGSLFEGNCVEGVTYLIFDTPIVIKPGLHLTRFYSKNINLTRPIQDDRPTRYYISSNIEFLESRSELCPRIKIPISDKVSKDANIDNFNDIYDIIDKQNDNGIIPPKLPTIVSYQGLQRQIMDDDVEKNESDVIRDVVIDGQDDNDAGNSGTCRKLFWEYEFSRGRWIKYDNIVNKKLNDSIANDVAEFEMDESKLQIDFNSMKQKNLDTGFVRSVRCAIRNDEGAYRIWEYIDSKRRWRSVNPTSAIALENAFSDGSGNVKILLSGINFIADFESNLIRSDDGLMEYKIRSHVSNAEPSMSAKPVPRVERLRATKRIAMRSDTHSLGSKRKATTNEDVKNDSSGDDDNTKKQVNRSKKTYKKKNDNSESQNSNDSNSTNSKDYKSDLKKVVVKGIAAVDPECELVNTAHVYTEFDDVYDALLNQTSTQHNKNKYFIIQLLESDISNQYWVWFHWGRVGYKGQTSLNPCDTNLSQAKRLFCDKFKDKTRNYWTERSNFKKEAGKYDYLPTDYSKMIKEKMNENDAEEKKEVESKLDPYLQHLLNIICNIRAMEETMTELEYDATKAPLGKVTDEQIKAGYALLGEIEQHIKNKDFSTSFVEAVNNYYTKIPHFFGMRQPPMIKTLKQLKNEIKLLEALREIGVAIRTFKKKGDVNIHPIDHHYMNMKCEVSVLTSNDPRYKIVDNYLQWTHAPTHNMYQMRIHNLYAVNRNGEQEQFMFDLGNRKLLWHGSRLTNWYGILSQGLRIAPPEAPVTGYMFGKAQVALGEMNELLQGDNNADKLPAGKNSTKGVGSVGPDPATYTTLDDCEVPCGKPIKLHADDKDCFLRYNEYIVYDVKQVWIRYLVEVDFIFD